MEMLNPDDLTIYKFEPNNIIMIHKQTKTLYQYYQMPVITIKEKNLFHNNLLQASFLPTGLLYKKGITSMQAQTSKRMKMINKSYYQEEQIINTFLPVLQCVQYLHSKDIVHGSLSSQNIIFTEEGEVLLRDWLLEREENRYYEGERFRERGVGDDYAALGMIILEAATLVEVKSEVKSILSIETQLRKILTKFTRGFILALYIMIRKIDRFYPHIEKIIKNNQTYIDSSEQLIVLYKKIKGEKEFKPLVNPTLINHSSYKFVELLCKTPIATKKGIKIEDVENKKINIQQTKKKNIDRVHRIAEKNSNCEITKKSDMALKKMSNVKLNNAQDPQKSFKKGNKQQILKFGSPLKRLRTISKKKAF